MDSPQRITDATIASKSFLFVIDLARARKVARRTFKIALGLKPQDLTSKQRDEVLNILRGI
jgi:hypothetical protein